MLLSLAYLALLIFFSIIILLLQQYNFAFTLTLGNLQLHFTALSSFIILLLLLGSVLFLYHLVRFLLYYPTRFLQKRYIKHQNKYVDLLQQSLLAYLAHDDAKIISNFAQLSAISDHKNSPALTDLHQSLFPLLQAKNMQILQNYEDASKMQYDESLLQDKSADNIALIYQLYCEARAKNDFAQILHYSLKAFQHSNGCNWANDSIISHYIMMQEWQKAEDFVQQILACYNKNTSFYKLYNRKLALVKAAWSENISANNIHYAKKLIKESYDLDKTHIGINLLYAIILYHCGEDYQSKKLLLKFWQDNGHPDYANLYLRLFWPKSPLEGAFILQNMQPNNVYSYLALSKLYLQQNEHDKAEENILQALEIEPLYSCYRQLKNIKQKTDKISEMQIAKEAYDYSWVADYILLQNWQILSPYSKIIDAVKWQKIFLDPMQKNSLAKNNAPLLDINEAQSINYQQKILTHINVDDPGVAQEEIY